MNHLPNISRMLHLLGIRSEFLYAAVAHYLAEILWIDTNVNVCVPFIALI
jgi:hypothetical protein